MTVPVRVRFAPSPTGLLHIGTARTALFNWLFARHESGVFILRIEDTDRERSTVESEEAILRDLKWLGLDWDEGPDIGGPSAPYRQSERLAAGIYDDAFKRLLESGALYECYCSPAELAAEREAALARKEMPKYSGRCRGLGSEEKRAFRAAGRLPSWRFAVPQDRVVAFDDLIRGRLEFSTDVIGDFIVGRSDGMPTYNMAAAVDDGRMEITHVIRGEDHLTNTARQLLIMEALGDVASKFAHLPMILGPEKAKLSKRYGAASVGEYRDKGYLAGALVNNLALLSWSAPSGEEVLNPADIERAFSLDRVSKSPPIFDGEKLRWFNAQHIRRLDPAALARLTRPFLPSVWAETLDGESGGERWRRIVEAIAANLELLSDVKTYAKIFFEVEHDGATRDRLASPAETAIREAAAKALGGRDEMTVEEAKEFIATLKDDMRAAGYKPKEVFQTLRLGLTGQLSGPEVFYLIYGLGPDECRRRLALIDGD